MSTNIPIGGSGATAGDNITAPTPVNTPLTTAPIAHGLSRPTVPAISEEDEGALGNTGDLKSALAGMVHGRLSELVGKSSGYIESLPVEVRRSVEGLKGVQVKQDELIAQYKKECLALEKKYLGLTQPLYNRRDAIITGASQPTDEEVAAGEAQTQKDDPEEYKPLPKDSTTSAPIPEFWLTALRNHIGLSDLITERDAGALKHLKDISLAYLDESSPSAVPEVISSLLPEDVVKEKIAGKPGFFLVFKFDANEYFENETLVKVYVYQDEVGYGGDFIYDCAVGCEIKWKSDMDLTREFEIKKQRNKNTNRTRLVRKSKPTESFFNFFSPPVPPSKEAIESDEIDEEELEEIETRLEMDYQIGEDLKEKIIPKAVDYFTGKALEYDMLDESDWDDSEEDDSDDSEGSDDLSGSGSEGSEEDDSDGNNPVPKTHRVRGGGGGRRGGKKGSSGTGLANPDDCKQQ